MMLGRDTLRERFQALGPSGLDLYPITLDKSLQDVMVSRVFMSAEYGGGSQAVCPTIGKKHIEKHGMNDFMFLHPEYQPVAPQVPGACGLFMSPGTSVGHEWPSVQRLFTRIESNVWQYMGMYRLMSSPSLTKREWADQDRKVNPSTYRLIFTIITYSTYRCNIPGEKKSVNNTGVGMSVHGSLLGKDSDENQQNRSLKTCLRREAGRIQLHRMR